jgi:hypothetical protein
MSSLVLRILTNASKCANTSKHQKRESGHFQPELVQYAAERRNRGPDALPHGGTSPAAPGLLGRYAGNDPQFPQRRDLDHQSILAAAERTITVANVTVGCDVRRRPRPL